MLSQRSIECLVGIFIVIALLALTLLALKVSGLTSLLPVPSYRVTALFDEIGGLKPKAPVKVGGVQVGQVTQISLDPVTFKANVTLEVMKSFDRIPDDSSASILTAGLLGDNYIAIIPMYSKSFLKEGDEIQITQSAMVLEKLIGKFIYRMGQDNSAKNNQTGEHHESSQAIHH